MDQKMEDARAALRENVIKRHQPAEAFDEIMSTARIAKVEKELGRLPGTERQLIGIQRKFDLNNSVYTYLLERRAEAGIAKASQITDNRIIDKAIVQNSAQIKPKTDEELSCCHAAGTSRAHGADCDLRPAQQQDHRPS